MDRDLRDRVVAALGWRPGDLAVADVAVAGARPVAHGVRHDLTVTFSDGARTAGVMLMPAAWSSAAVLYLHAHGFRYEVGAEEVCAGRPALTAPWGPDLLAMGIAALSIDLPTFGARQSPGEDAMAKAELWRGRTLFGRMLAELAAALAWLGARPGTRRLGAMGFSMGGTLAWWLAALSEAAAPGRLDAAVSLGAFADLDHLIATGAHDLHGHYMTVPGLVALAPTGVIAGMAAPRPLFIGAGAEDPGTPPAAWEAAIRDLRDAYAAAPGALDLHYEPGLGHRESPAMRAAAAGFLSRHLLQV